MKKSLIALAVLAASGAAMAQSSVTLYGVLDTGVSYFKGDDSVYGLTKTGGNVNSRLGFRGVEDLGNGLKATFNLEAGMGVDDGNNYMDKDSNGMAFRRTSTVGLAGNFGEVRLGRELTASYMAVSRYDVFGDTGIGASLAWKRDYASRTENAITYYSPVFSGFKVGVNYGFGERKSAANNRYMGLGFYYDNGPLSAGLGYDYANRGHNNGATAVDNLTTWQLGAAYNFGVAKVAAFYKETKEEAPGANASDKFKTFGLGVTAPVGAAGEVKASYNNYRLSPDVGSTLKADQLSLGYVHNLSKRTALYGTYAYIKNKNKDGDNLGLQLNGAMPGADLSDSGAQHGLQVGIRHAF